MRNGSHIVLLGDSIFDNAAYVATGWSVIELLKAQLAPPWKATLLAVDGAVVRDVADQLQRLPGDAGHLVISCGGNDALNASVVTETGVASVMEALTLLAQLRDEFREEYRKMLQAARSTGLPVTVCTVYNAVPGLRRELEAALALFNDVILYEAAAAELSVIDLRLLCTETADYSVRSPIEPSEQGGVRISGAIARRIAGTAAMPSEQTELHAAPARAPADDPFELGRFLAAQEGVYAQVVRELAGGRKRSHWMWFIFPQLQGLGRSPMAERYAIRSVGEARAFLAHPILGSRLRECTRLVSGLKGRHAREIFDSPDDVKFRSCMTLFERVADDGVTFAHALERLWAGQRCERTLQMFGHLP